MVPRGLRYRYPKPSNQQFILVLVLVLVPSPYSPLSPPRPSLFVNAARKHRSPARLKIRQGHSKQWLERSEATSAASS